MLAMKVPHRPIHLVRHQNFRKVIGDAPGAITEAARRLGKSQGQVSHFGGADPIKVIGDKIAAQIEEVYGLPEGSLDTLNESALPTKGTLPLREETVSLPAAADIVAEAEHWVRYEERRFGELRPVRRAERLLQLCRQIQADGGHLSPEHAEAIIQSQGDHYGTAVSARQ